MKNKKIRSVAVCAIMSALSFILMLLEISVPFVPSFLKFDFSDLPAIITSFSLGPVWAVAVCLVKNLLHMPFSNSMFVGELSNFLLGASFVLVSGLIYKKHKSRKGALVACLLGAFFMASVCVAVNYFIVYPIYAEIFMPMEAILGAYKAILPSIDNLLEALLIFNLPFTFIKGIIISAICFVVYKKISPILKNKS